MPYLFIRYCRIPASMSPERVPMGRPARGVKPMEVSTLLPPSTAVTEEPLPRWQEISFSSSRLLAQHSGSALGDILVRGAVEAVAADLVLLIVLVGQGIHIGLGGHGLMEGGVEHGHLGTSLPMTAVQALMPVMLAGLWRGARGMHSSRAFMTSSVMRTDLAKASPPCTTRWPTASISFMEPITPLSLSTRAFSTA